MNLPTWVIYSLLTILVSVPFYFQIRKDGGAGGDNFQAYFRRLMLVPGIVALGYRLVTDRGFGDIDWGVGEQPWLLLVAVLFPLVMEILLIFTNIIFSLARLDPEIIFIGGGKVRVSKSIRLLFGNELQSRLKFSLNLTVTVVVGSLVILVFSLVEEFGWRGFLQEELVNTFGLGWGLTMVGVVWGLWYLPVVLMGHQFPDYPLLGGLVFMPVFLISASILTGYIFFLSGSIWAAGLFNAATKISGLLAANALGDAGTSKRVRFVWLWLWAVAAGIALVFWAFG